MTKKTLILSNLTDDSHVPRLVAEFDRLGHPWVIFDPGDFPQKVQVSASISNESKCSFLAFTDCTRIRLEEITSIWYRRPTRILPRDDLPGIEQTFIQREAHAGIWGWLRGLQALWVNHPDAVRAAGHKPEQLQRATMLGLAIPRSVVTNEPDVFKRFYEECGGSVVYKLMGYPWYSDKNETPISTFTSLVSREMLAEAQRVTATMHLFQEFIVKQCDIRVIILGEKAFATAIYPLSEATQIDFRADYQQLRYTPHQLPDHICQSLLTLTRSYHLSYAAIDLLLTPEDRYVFLELNPLGQFGWLEGRTGIPLYHTVGNTFDRRNTPMINVQATESLVQNIEKQLGRALTPSVRKVFLQVPRHLFVQQYYQQRGNSLDWELVQATEEQIYRDEALVTQIDRRGMPSSSTSQPSVMAVQLEALELEHGQRVLEIGAGTGYNAALLGKLVGDHGNEAGQVISLEIDTTLAEQAREHLARAAIHNVVVLPGNGFSGEMAYALYDRILSTCSIRTVPHAWFEQLKTGGRLVGNWLTPLASLFLSVEKVSTGELVGRLLNLSATYMEMQMPGVSPSKDKIDWTHYDRLPLTSLPLSDMKTRLQNPAYSLLLHCLLPEMKKRYRSKGDQVYLALLARGNAILVQDDGLLISGDEGIGQIIQQSVDLYDQSGQPGITDYRVTLQERQVAIYVGDRCFHLPIS